jgi:hypothetical protein
MRVPLIILNENTGVCAHEPVNEGNSDVKPERDYRHLSGLRVRRSDGTAALRNPCDLTDGDEGLCVGGTLREPTLAVTIVSIFVSKETVLK